MNVTERERLKILIQLSHDVREADEIIEEFMHFETFEEKIAFLKGMFDVEMVCKPKKDSTGSTYFAMLRSILL